MVSLMELGLRPALLAGVDLNSSLVGRVTEEQKHAYRVMTELGALWARPSGRLLHQTEPGELPTVGDFVLIRRQNQVVTDALIEDGWHALTEVLPRYSCLRRKAAGGGAQTQLLAANIDLVLIVNSLNRDLNIRRLERYLLAVWDSGATPVVILSKADLTPARDELMAQVQQVAMGALILPVSVLTGEGLSALRDLVGPGKTAVLVGSSGVGKSTLTNALLGSVELVTQEVRGKDDKGRHTTSYRSLWHLPTGGLLIDTPGMREFMPWATDGETEGSGVAFVFQDVDALVQACRFSDCQHLAEPGCAVQAALTAGTLEPERLGAWRKAQKEQAFLARRSDQSLASAERRKWKTVAKQQRQKKKQGRWQG